MAEMPIGCWPAARATPASTMKSSDFERLLKLCATGAAVCYACRHADSSWLQHSGCITAAVPACAVDTHKCEQSASAPQVSTRQPGAGLAAPVLTPRELYRCMIQSACLRARPWSPTSTGWVGVADQHTVETEPALLCFFLHQWVTGALDMHARFCVGSTQTQTSVSVEALCGVPCRALPITKARTGSRELLICCLARMRTCGVTSSAQVPLVDSES